jgi:predicted nucleotidyltransferase
MGELNPNYTKESINKLYRVNEIRDLLTSNSDGLVKAGVKSVLIFGSVDNGTASETSDTDFWFIHQPYDSLNRE